MLYPMGFFFKFILYLLSNLYTNVLMTLMLEASLLNSTKNCFNNQFCAIAML